MQKYNTHYINGQWQEPYGTELLDVVNPATEAVIAQVRSSDERDAVRALEAASAAFPSWSQTSSAQRSEIILKIAELMEARKLELAKLISQSMGCPDHIALWLQVEDPITCMRSFAEFTSITETTERIGHSMVVHEPVGVCGFINPWNFPLHQMVGKVGAALAAGCTMVVKPSEQTPLQDYLMAEIMHEAGLPAGVFNLLPGRGADVGRVLSSHPLVDMISFTGSTGAGIEVAKAAAPTVKRVAQELGGKSPFIITEDADLEAAVRCGIEDVMLNSGQTCTALTRMLVPSSRYQEAKALAAKVVAELKIGMSADAFLGPLSSKSHQQKVLDYIQVGLDEGATLLCGGLDKPAGVSEGYYVAPTIFTEVSNKMRIAQEEIFGPVLCMISYDSIDEAIAIANDTPYGLSSAIYAKDENAALSIALRIRAGMCNINGGQFNCHSPFGGYKQSGNGRELGAAGVHEFLEVKSIQLAS